MKKYRLVAIIAILLVVFALPRVFFVPYVTNQLEQEIARSLQAREVKVQLETTWGWDLLFGRLPKLQFIASGAVIDGLQIARVELEGREIRFDPRLLLQEQELVYTAPFPVQGEIVVTENSLNELLWESVDPDRLLRFSVVPEGLDLGGTIQFWNLQWTVTLRGDLEVQHGTALRYVFRDLALSDTKLPPILLDVLSENYELVLDFGAFPYPVELEDVFLTEQEILITFGGQI